MERLTSSPRLMIVSDLDETMNYSSIVTVHPEIIEGRAGTMVIESFVVDVLEGNTKDETCYFVEALIRCNLKSLADVSERLASQDLTQFAKIGFSGLNSIRYIINEGQ